LQAVGTKVPQTERLRARRALTPIGGVWSQGYFLSAKHCLGFGRPSDFGLAKIMPRKSQIKPHSTRVLDYSATMSQYEIESLAAEATLKAEKKLKNGPWTTHRKKKSN